MGLTSELGWQYGPCFATVAFAVQRGEPGGSNDECEQPKEPVMMVLGKASYFLLGVAAGPVIRSVVRVTARELIKSSFLAQREVRRFAAKVREEIQDAAAEARSEHESVPRQSA